MALDNSINVEKWKGEQGDAEADETHEEAWEAEEEAKQERLQALLKHFVLMAARDGEEDIRDSEVELMHTEGAAKEEAIDAEDLMDSENFKETLHRLHMVHTGGIGCPGCTGYTRCTGCTRCTLFSGYTTPPLSPHPHSGVGASNIALEGTPDPPTISLSLSLSIHIYIYVYASVIPSMHGVVWSRV